MQCHTCEGSGHHDCPRLNVACERCRRYGHCQVDCRSKWCEHCERWGHLKVDCFQQVTCSKCNKAGHPTERCTAYCSFCRKTGRKDTAHTHTAWSCRYLDLPNYVCNKCGKTGHTEDRCTQTYAKGSVHSAAAAAATTNNNTVEPKKSVNDIPITCSSVGGGVGVTGMSNNNNNNNNSGKTWADTVKHKPDGMSERVVIHNNHVFNVVNGPEISLVDVHQVLYNLCITLQQTMSHIVAVQNMLKLILCNPQSATAAAAPAAPTDDTAITTVAVVAPPPAASTDATAAVTAPTTTCAQYSSNNC